MKLDERIITWGPLVVTYDPPLWGCFYGDEPALLAGLTLVRGLDFASPLHGNFLAHLGGLDLARMRYRREIGIATRRGLG